MPRAALAAGTGPRAADSLSTGSPVLAGTPPHPLGELAEVVEVVVADGAAQGPDDAGGVIVRSLDVHRLAFAPEAALRRSTDFGTERVLDPRHQASTR